MDHDVLLLHYDGGREPAEAKEVCDDLDVEVIGLIQIAIKLSELADEFRVNGKDFGLSLFKRRIFIHEHGEMPAIDLSCF
ncbi:hypothetical protein BK142_12385 [Paenibacillus glucanolyticus]|nr:hypothetical protein BK142_12385 [Paenibacillus glucanolyticus]